jgi:electron transfer flavoprotein alpha subunit
MENITIEKGTGAIWVVADLFENIINPVTYQLLGKARQLADQQNKSVACVILGHEIDAFSNLLFQAGANIVYKAKSPELRFYQQTVYTDTIVKLARVQKPEIILLGSTSMGRELAPLVAAELKTGLSAHCIDLGIDKNGVLEQKIPAFGGLMTIMCPIKRPQMASCAQGVFPNPEMDKKRTGITVDVEVCNSASDRIKTLDIVKEPVTGVSLESASAVVAGGAGAGDKDGWNLIMDFSEQLNAALGCTRPAVDEGWAELDTMIGQSGKMINPDLYIGIGLSGELQHMVGIMDVNLMIAINNDEKSPVFEQVDYGVIDDCREFLPVLIEKIKESRKS